MAIPLAADRERAQAMAGHESKAWPEQWRVVVPILSVALALRMFAMAFMFRADPRVWFYNQASELNCLAESILSGHGLSSPFGGATGPSAFLAPGYPLLVALVYRLFGVCSLGSAVVLAAVQVIFGVMTVLIVMLVARHLFGGRIAPLAGTLCAMSPTMIWLPALFWETSLSTLLLVAALRLALLCADRPKPMNWITLGAYCGLALLVNPALLLTFAGMYIWAALSAQVRLGRALWLAPLACLLVYSAWPIRNAVVLRAFVPLRSNLGYELWQGNRPGSRGFFTHELYLNEDREEYRRYAAIGELPYMREKSAIAAAAIEADPRRFARLSFVRAGAFWTALGGHNISWIVICEITVASVVGVAALVLLIARRKPGAALLLIPFALFPLPYYVTHPDFRFRLLLQPVALILVAWLFREFPCVNADTRDR